MIRIHDAMGDRNAARDTVARALQSNPESVELNLMQADLQ